MTAVLNELDLDLELPEGVVLPPRPELILPTHYHAPDYVSSLGDEVADLCKLAKFEPDAEQRFALDGIFGLTKRGKLAAFETCVIAGRQNLKTGLKKQAALGKVFLLKRPLYVWTAHEFPTAAEAFRDLCQLIESTPEFDRRVQHIHRGNGDEAIELDNGQRIIFRARTKTGGKGLSGDDVGYDEAFALEPLHVGSTMPLLSARPNPQVGYWSSAGYGKSAVLRSVRDRGRAHKGRALLYIEYCFPGEPGELCESAAECDHQPETAGCSLDNLELIQQANTQAGGRISWSYLLNERVALSGAGVKEYGRERAGWWDEPDNTDDAPAIDGALWRDLLNAKAKPPRRAVVAVAVSPKRRFSTVAVAGRGSQGRTLVFVKHAAGTGWVVPYLKRRAKRDDIAEVVLNLSGPAGFLKSALKKADIDFRALTGPEVSASVGWIQDAVTNGEVEHGGQAELLTAVENAKTRTSTSQAEMWDLRDPDVDITALEGVAMAGSVWSAGEGDYDVTESVW